MNNIIPALKRCLTELTKEKPSLEYIRGMLETLIELNQPQGTLIAAVQAKPTGATASTPASDDPAAILDALARAKLDHVKKATINE